MMRSCCLCRFHHLKTFSTRGEGRIRLSEDDGPSAAEFLEDDYDHDPQSPVFPITHRGDDDDDEPLAERMARHQQSRAPQSDGVIRLPS
jgi:hypothetical protein